MKTNIIRNLVLALISALGFISCNIKEDMSNCPGYFILDYSKYPASILDGIDPQAEVCIYVFDANEKCSEILTYTYGQLQSQDFTITVPIKYRNRYAQVWHKSSDVHYNDQPMVVGAPLEDFRMSLNHNNGVFDDKPTQLWASMLEKVDFCKSKTRHRLFMTRIDTEVNVKINKKISEEQKESLNTDNFKISIEGTNNIYYRDYTIDPQSSLVSYTNQKQPSKAVNATTAEMGTLRVTTDRECLLKVYDAKTNQPVKVQGQDYLDLKKYMLQSKTDAEQNDQDFLDINKVWDVELSVDEDLEAISLNINGWTVWFNETDLN